MLRSSHWLSRRARAGPPAAAAGPSAAAAPTPASSLSSASAMGSTRKRVSRCSTATSLTGTSTATLSRLWTSAGSCTSAVSGSVWTEMLRGTSACTPTLSMRTSARYCGWSFG